MEKEWQPTPVFLPEKSYGQRSLAGYSPWGCKNWTQCSGQTTPPITTRALQLSLTFNQLVSTSCSPALAPDRFPWKLNERNEPSFLFGYIDSSLRRTDQELLYQGPRGKAAASPLDVPSGDTLPSLKSPGGSCLAEGPHLLAKLPLGDSV